MVRKVCMFSAGAILRNVFDPQLAEPMDVEPGDTEG